MVDDITSLSSVSCVAYNRCGAYCCSNVYITKTVFSQPSIVQVPPLKKMRRGAPENHIVGFFMNLFANYGGKYVFGHLQTSKISDSHRPVTSSLRGSSVLHSLPVLMAPV